MRNFFAKVLLGAVLIAPIAVKAYQPVRYHDREHNDDHEWNEAEDKAYRGWVSSKHYTYREFNKLNAKRQQEYWRWRHDHPDRG